MTLELWRPPERLRLGDLRDERPRQDDIHAAIGKGPVTGKPAMIIAHTIKGKATRETEGLVDRHNVKHPQN